MNFEMDESGVMDVFQKSWCVAVYEDHLGIEQSGYIEKAIQTVEQIKEMKNITKPTLYVLRSGKSALRVKIQQRCIDHVCDNSVLFKVNWGDGKLAGLKTMDEMLDHCEAAVCVTDNISASERAFIEKIKDKNINACIIYTGAVK